MQCSYERLGTGLEVCVTGEHRFGTDAFLLSDFAAPRRKDLACDLGSGCGIIPLLWFREEGPQKVWAVEIQEQAVEQMKDSVRRSALEGRMIPVQADLKDLPPELPRGAFDLVTCNPPYKAAGRGILSETGAERAARHEVLCTLPDVCRAAASLLRFGGRFCLCQRPERLADVICALRENGIEPKTLRFVQKRPDTAPWLFLLEGKKGSRPFLKVEPPLVVQGEGGFSEEMLRIYHKEHNL
ncbi:MAG: methyltransferase [Oscillospiraceae bacterium]|nr:methyltransferase [Oscillospiraceae bacterium]